jgi:uncharacterized OB-fold protein
MKKARFIGTPSKVVENDPAMVIEWPRNLVHYHTYGQLSRFFEELKKGKLFATHCVNSKCFEKKLWIPPRADCPDCHQPMEWQELPKPVIGEIFTFTRVEYPGEGIELSTPYWQIDVEIPGLATIPKSYLLYGKPHIGMKVKAGFRTRKPTNTILDLYWVPLKE